MTTKTTKKVTKTKKVYVEAQNALDNAKQVKTYKPKSSTPKLHVNDVIEAMTLIVVFVLAWRFLAGM